MASVLFGKEPEAGRWGLQEGRGLVYHTCVDRMPVRQRVEEAGFPNLAQVPDFHRFHPRRLWPGASHSTGSGPHGSPSFVHSQIPELRTRARFRLGCRTEAGGWEGKGRAWARENPTSLPSTCSAGSRAPRCLP